MDWKLRTHMSPGGALECSVSSLEAGCKQPP
jgi:hypothetical protein